MHFGSNRKLLVFKYLKETRSFKVETKVIVESDDVISSKPEVLGYNRKLMTPVFQQLKHFDVTLTYRTNVCIVLRL